MAFFQKNVIRRHQVPPGTEYDNGRPGSTAGSPPGRHSFPATIGRWQVRPERDAGDDQTNREYGIPLKARTALDEELSSNLFTIEKDVKVQVAFNPALVSQCR